MKHYVSLSTDAAPTYSVWAPLAVRTWKIHGYTPIVVVHTEDWGTPHGQLTLRELEDAGAIVVECPAVAPLSIANTMRCVRWATPCLSFLEPDDVVVTSDVDIIPIDRDWFRADDVGTFTHLRSLLPWRCDGRGDTFQPEDMAPGRMRLSMSYFAASVARWRELLPELRRDDLARSLRAFNFAEDSFSVDELVLSSRVLGSVMQHEPRKIAAGRWQRGPLELREPVHAMPRTNAAIPGLAMPFDVLTGADAIDAITPRAKLNNGDVLCMWPLRDLVPYAFPELCAWAKSYMQRLGEVFAYTHFIGGAIVPDEAVAALPPNAIVPFGASSPPVHVPEVEPDITITGRAILTVAASGSTPAWERFVQTHQPHGACRSFDDEVATLAERGFIIDGSPPQLTTEGKARLTRST